MAQRRIDQFHFRGPTNLDLDGIEGLGDAIGDIGRNLRNHEMLETRRNDLARVGEIARNGGTVEEINRTLAGSKDSALQLMGIRGLTRQLQQRAEREFQLRRQQALAGRNAGRTSNPRRGSHQPRRDGSGVSPFLPARNPLRPPLPDRKPLPNVDEDVITLASLESHPETAGLLDSAIDAVHRGADPAAVRRRLFQSGVKFTGVA